MAERGAVFLCAATGIFPRTMENQPAPIGGWPGALRSDKRLLPIAAAHARKAANFILQTGHAPNEGLA